MEGPIISCSRLNDLLGDPNVRVVDCRYTLKDPAWGQSQYNMSHIPGAVYAHLDHDLSSPVVDGATGRHPLPRVDKLVTNLEKWGIGNDSHVVVYDQSIGAIAARLWWLLRWLGHDRVNVLEGGWDAWIHSGYPADNQQPAPVRASFQPDVQDDLVVDVKQVESMASSGDDVVVDSRTNERYLGLDEPIDPVAGHIPGAINLPFAENVGANGLWKPEDELKARFQGAGIESADKTAFYCGSGVTGCHNVLGMEYAGLGMARLYPGSWSHWITDPHRPVATGQL